MLPEIDQWFSIRAILTPRGHLVMSGDTGIVTTEEFYWYLVGGGQGSCSPPNMHRTAPPLPPPESDPSSGVSGAKAEKL